LYTKANQTERYVLAKKNSSPEHSKFSPWFVSGNCLRRDRGGSYYAKM